jgi:ATP-dependent DNA ligase
MPARGLSFCEIDHAVAWSSPARPCQRCVARKQAFYGKHNDEVQLYAFDILALNGDDLRSLRLSMRKAHLSRLLARRPDGIFISPFEQGEIGPDLFRAACNMGLEGLVSKRSKTAST